MLNTQLETGAKIRNNLHTCKIFSIFAGFLEITYRINRTIKV